MSISIANNNISSSGTLTLNNKALANVAFTGSYDDLSDKPNIGSGGLLTSKWHDGVNWYREYDDGYIEQGGQLTPNTSDNVTVSLHTPFVTAEYSVYLTRQDNTPNGNNITLVSTRTRTTSQFKAHTQANQVMFWKAEGY